MKLGEDDQCMEKFSLLIEQLELMDIPMSNGKFGQV